MADQTKEEFYDSEIAPVLAELAKKCQDRGMAIIAAVDIGGADHGRTAAIPENSHPVFGWLNALAQCAEEKGVNIDKFMFGIMRDAVERGHSSTVLRSLGISLKPKAEEPRP